MIAYRLSHPARRGRRNGLMALVQALCLTLPCLLLDGTRAQCADPSTVRAETPVQPGDADYVLGPLDKVRLKVFAWRPSRDEVFEWKALNDVYTVGASGQLSLPLIGDVAASGRNLRELCQAVSDGLKEKLGVVEAPSTTAEIAEFRPFYIFGAVQRPGEYSYRPRLTIIQALSLAGGLQRLNELEAIRLERETISTVGETQIIENEINSLLAKRARLEAESNDAGYVEFPPALTRFNARFNGGAAVGGAAVREEQNIFNARRSGFELRAKELERMRSAYQKEIKSTEETLDAQIPYMDVAKQEFKQFDELYAKKLTALNRVAEAARNVMQVQAERLRLESSLTRARQDLSRLDMDLLELRNARVNQAIAEFRTTQARLDELKRRYATAETLLRESPASSARLVSTGDQPRRSRISYTITRPGAGTAIDIAATETTFVQPGDTIRVELPSRDDVSPTTTADNDLVSAQPTTVAGAGSARGRQLGVDALLTAAPLRSEGWRSR